MEFDRESELIRRITLRDEDAFKELFQRYASRLAPFFIHRTQDREVTEELIQETMITVWEKANRFDGSSKLSTWIFGIAYRKFLEWYRGQRKRSMKQEDWLTPERAATMEASSQQTAERALIQERIQEAIQRAFIRLPDKYQVVMDLTFYHGYSYREIARIVDCREGTVKSRMYYGKEKLKEALVEMGFGGDQVWRMLQGIE
ncbi:MAG: RNA polymerase sigma factor [Candidatus Bipolaricaulia bacterium]